MVYNFHSTLATGSWTGIKATKGSPKYSDPHGEGIQGSTGSGVFGEEVVILVRDTKHFQCNLGHTYKEEQIGN